jgi:hypothetical protein
MTSHHLEILAKELTELLLAIEATHGLLLLGLDALIDKKSFTTDAILDTFGELQERAKEMQEHTSDLVSNLRTTRTILLLAHSTAKIESTQH